MTLHKVKYKLIFFQEMPVNPIMIILYNSDENISSIVDATGNANVLPANYDMLGRQGGRCVNTCVCCIVVFFSTI